MVIAIVLMFLGSSSKDQWIVFLRSLQLIVVQIMISISVPSNILDLYGILIKIAFYDILSQYNIWVYFSFLDFKKSDVPFITQQMQTIQFDDRNAFTGLGSVTIYFLAYFSQIILLIIVKIFVLITGEIYLKKKVLQVLIKGLFFNTILTLTMEGFFELLVNGILNIYTRDTSTIGEILGFAFSIICIFLTVIFVPIALFWAIFSKDDT